MDVPLQSGGFSKSLMSPEPHTEITSGLGNSIFGAFFSPPSLSFVHPDFGAPCDLVHMIASFLAGKVSRNRRKCKQHFTQHTAGRACSQQRLQTQSGLIKTTLVIIHVEAEVTTSPAPEANLSPAGCTRRFPLSIALSQGSPARPRCKLHKGSNKMCFLSLVTAAQHRRRLCTERGGRTSPYRTHL